MKFKTHELHINTKFNQGIVVDKISHIPPYDFTQTHRHNYYEMLLFVKGAGGIQIIDFDSYTVKDKTLYTIAPGQIHLLRNKPEAHGISIQFTEEFLQLNFSPLHKEWVNLIKNYTELTFSPAVFDHLLLLAETLHKAFDSKSSLAYHKTANYISLLLIEVFEFINQTPQYQTSKPDNIALQFVALMQKNFRQTRGVQTYADLMNLSTSRLTKHLKQSLGKSPKELIQGYLLLEIKRLLAADELSHKEISYQLNFDSQNSYNRFIRKHTACTPSELRSRLAEIHK